MHTQGNWSMRLLDWYDEDVISLLKMPSCHRYKPIIISCTEIGVPHVSEKYR
jgi:hypothetical protein